MRKLLVTVTVLGALLVAADRVAVAVASGVVASELRTSGSLESDPSVAIKGFPFLTQALGGKYDRIELSATSLSRGGVRLARLDATIVGTRLPLADALGGAVSSVPVDGLSATALVTYADLAAMSKVPEIALAPVTGGVRVSGRLVILGRTVTASTVSTVRLERGDIVFTARSMAVDGRPVSGAAAGLLDLRVPVGKLPYGLALTGVQITGPGLVLSARSGPTTLVAPR